jgi:hypothetical protein
MNTFLNITNKKRVTDSLLFDESHSKRLFVSKFEEAETGFKT